MKTFAALAAFLFAASLLSAETPPATGTTDTAAKDLKSAQTTNQPAKNDTKKKPEPEPKIPGVTIPRANGTFLGLEVADNRFKLSFYDKKKKPMAPDVTRATARWPNTRSAVKAFNRSVLNPGTPTAFIGSNPVQPPFVGNVFLTLLQGDGDDAQAVETYSVPFHG